MDTLARFVSPFQGWAWGGQPRPEALPRAGLFWPLRGKDSPQPRPSHTFTFPIARIHLASRPLFSVQFLDQPLKALERTERLELGIILERFSRRAVAFPNGRSQ